MSAALISAEEAFLFPTHFAGDISATGGLRINAYRGADIVQGTEGHVSPELAGKLYKDLLAEAAGVEHAPAPESVLIKLRDAFTDHQIDELAERIYPGFKEVRVDAGAGYSLTHHLVVASNLGMITGFCNQTAGTPFVASARFGISASHAYLTIYANADVVGVSLWDSALKDDAYSHRIVTPIVGDGEFKKVLMRLAAAPARGFSTACALLSKMNPAAVSREADPTTGDIRSAN